MNRKPGRRPVTLRRPIAVKDDLTRMLRALDNRAPIFLEDDAGNLVGAEAELIEDQGPGAPAFLVIKRRP